jgi:hypothetical protein
MFFYGARQYSYMVPCRQRCNCVLSVAGFVWHRQTRVQRRGRYSLCKYLISLAQLHSSPESNYILAVMWSVCPSQWPRGLRHEISSPARTLGSWIRIPLEACMSVCVCVVLCVVAALRRADPPSEESAK